MAMEPIDERIEHLEERIRELRGELADLRRARPSEEVKDYGLVAADGTATTLASLFGNKRDLVLVHNMGHSCPWCAMWADGFNGVLRYIQGRAAFAVTSPDPPAVQRETAARRGWRFPMYSTAGTSFTADMGFGTREGGFMPGVSAFHRDEDGRIFRTARASFDARDDFCVVWHLLDLLQDGAAGWEPSE